jgi:two-component system nitrogen regulation sensor histidine kinase NtrY
LSRLFRNPFKSALVLIVISVLLSLVVAFFTFNKNEDPLSLIKEAENKTESLKNELVVSLQNIKSINNENDLRNFFRRNQYSRSGFTYYLFKSDQLKLWSDNQPAITDSILIRVHDNELLHLSNGDFLSYKLNWSDTLLIGLMLIRHNYDYQNKYLINEFNPSIGLGDFNNSVSGLQFNLPGKAGSYSLTYTDGAKYDTPTWIIIFCMIVFMITLLAIFLLFRVFGKTSIGLIAFTAIVFLIRTVMIWFKWPAVLYGHSIFDPSFYASSFYFNSLGDLFINAALFLVLAISIYENASPYKKLKPLLFVYWSVTAIAVHLLIRGLVINSRLNFEMNSPADTNVYSFVAYTSISLLLLSFLFMTGSIWRNMRSYFINGRHAWIGITICSAYAAVLLSQLNIRKEHETRELLAQKAAVRRDHVAEYLFGEQEQKIEKDPVVHQMLHAPNPVQLLEYIIPEYLSGYFSKFETTIQIIDEKDSVDANTNLTFFNNLAAKNKSTESKNLYFINSEGGAASYLALIPIEDQSHSHTLVLNMTPRLFRTAKGFPELLMSGSYREVSPGDEYSIARYSSRTLVYQFGEFVYPLTGTDFAKKTDNTFFDLNGYSHLVHNLENNSFIVVSRPSTSFLGVLTLFSWMFIFMSISAFVIFLIAGFLTTSDEFQWNLTRKVQTSVLFLVILTFTIVGTATVFYIKSKYLNDQNKSISDQVNGLWFLINDNVRLNNLDTLTPEQKDQLNRLVSNTNIDFNLYSDKGKLLFSSQAKIFNVGIVSDRMNTMAYLKMIYEGLTQYIHPEKTGQLKYIAAYAPFTDRSGKITAFLNLPYFEKQNELNKDVSVFLSAIVNIYVLLFALAVFLTIFISSQITKPLLLIQERMSGIRLGSTNEKIAYSAKDEIGQLVHEYNRMIDELADSASKLARSERESAWREMARQVAHEIKNPLTPMKLSIQHLHRTLNEGTDKELVDRITTTLIKQIDSLSNIATAFSNFAKMPLPKPSKVDVTHVLAQVINLYDDSGNIHLHSDEGGYFVLADHDQLTGVFSNLLKNALQSVPGDRRGKVDIYLRREADRIVTEITDNGTGIPEDQMDKIFTPNFTTKSSGMGLGLAIARNIVNEANGSIWFTTKYGRGSSFFVALPEFKGDF